MIHLYGWAVKSIMLIIIRIVTINVKQPASLITACHMDDKSKRNMALSAMVSNCQILNWHIPRQSKSLWMLFMHKVRLIEGLLLHFCKQKLSSQHIVNKLIRDISHQRSKICERNGSRNFPLKKFSQERIYFKYLSTICWLITYLI